MRFVRNMAFLGMVCSAVFFMSEIARAYDLESCNPPAYELPHAVISLSDCGQAGSECQLACHECQFGNVIGIEECTQYPNPSLGYYAVCQCSTEINN